MRAEIIEKLSRELSTLIRGEPQLVYVMVEIRKLIELASAQDRYELLNFYADWLVHPQLDRNPVGRRMLTKFDLAVQNFPELDEKLHEFLEILSLHHLRQEMAEFLREFGLPDRLVTRDLDWLNFVNVYSEVISDCPLVVSVPRRAHRRRPSSSGSPSLIDRLTIQRLDSEGNRPSPMLIAPLMLKCELSKDGKHVASIELSLKVGLNSSTAEG